MKTNNIYLFLAILSACVLSSCSTTRTNVQQHHQSISADTLTQITTTSSGTFTTMADSLHEGSTATLEWTCHEEVLDTAGRVIRRKTTSARMVRKDSTTAVCNTSIADSTKTNTSARRVSTTSTTTDTSIQQTKKPWKPSVKFWVLALLITMDASIILYLIYRSRF